VLLVSLDSLHHVPGEQTHDALSIPLDPKQAVPLARAHQIDEAGESVLPLIERSIDVAEELLRLPDIHRPSRRLRRGLEESANLPDAVCGAGRGVAAVRRRRFRRRTFFVVAFVLSGRMRMVRGTAVVAIGRLGELDEDVPTRLAQDHVTGGRELLRKVAEAAGAVRTFGERRVEL